MRIFQWRFTLAAAAVLLAGVAGTALAQVAAPAPQPAARSTGQSLYLPVYSHIWHGEMDRRGEPTRTLMSVSVSIRNTDPSRPIRIVSAQYFDTDGRKLREYVPAPHSVAPMGTYEIFVPACTPICRRAGRSPSSPRHGRSRPIDYGATRFDSIKSEPSTIALVSIDQ
jgi:hypothetical protein